MTMNRRQIFSAGAGLVLAAAPVYAAEQKGPGGGGPARRRLASEFGAVGDGHADDTAALQSALDATFQDKLAGVLEIPAGIYRVTKTLTVNRDANIVHESGIVGNGAVLFSAIQDGGPVIEIESRAIVRFVRIEGIQIQGSGHEGHGLSIKCEHRGNAFYNFGIRDFVVQGCGGDGIHVIGNVFEGQVFNGYFRDNKGNGVTFSHGAENTGVSAVHFFGCIFGGNGVHGAELVNGVQDVDFHGCYFLLNKKFGLVAKYGCSLLSNCGFENNHAGAPDFEHGDAGLMLEVFGTLVGCTSYSIYHQTHLVRTYITNNLVMVGCNGYGGDKAKDAKLAKLDGKPGAAITMVGCRGGIEQSDKIQALIIGQGGAGVRFGSRWNDTNLPQLGDYRLWVDEGGRLRMKMGRPDSDGDGKVIGT